MIFDNEQKRAIFHLKGPLLVIAGPGSGKTATMIERLSRMITISKVDPDRILVITFSKAAALEMENRFYSRMGNKKLNVHFGTFHSIFLRMIKSYYKNQFNFNLISESDKKSILIRILNKLGYEFIINDFVDEVLLDITLFKNSDTDLSSYKPISCDIDLFLKIYSMYSENLLKRDFMDFDDIIILMYNLLVNKSDFRNCMQSKFDYVLIDEFQDINMLQFKSVYKLACVHNNIFAVGDEDQSIYGFRGSNPNIMLNFKKSFPNAEIIYLKNNYRSGYEIVKSAGNLIKNNRKRYAKEILSANEDNAFVVIKGHENETEQLLFIKKLINGIEDSSVAVLCRTNSMKNYFINKLKSDHKVVTVLTMHESKGLEFNTIIIPNVINGICPYKHSVYGCDKEEERRLFYVAVTRAKKNLYICYSKIYNNKLSKKSLFINELH